MTRLTPLLLGIVGGLLVTYAPQPLPAVGVVLMIISYDMYVVEPRERENRP